MRCGIPARILLTLLLAITLLGCCVPIFVAPDPPGTTPAAPRVESPVTPPVVQKAQEPLPSPLLTPYDPEKERKALERERARMPRANINASVAASLFKTATRLQREGETDRAAIMLEKIVRDFPKTPEAKEAAKRLREIR